jgi:phosphatidylserine/phosphatidylglycerophosphate/cardiolipin synthase-like enzyme
MKKVVLAILALLVVGYIVFDKIGDAGLSKEFIQKQDSLVQAVDSMKLDIAEKDKAIDSLVVVDEQLQDKLAHTKGKVIKVVQYVDSSKAVVDTYNEKELVTFFNQRYPKDTVTNKLPLAQPVLTYVAKDLVELDGAKKIITIKDSVIALTESRVNGKDSVIALFVKKEGTYKNIMVNQDIQIKDWKNQYNQIYLQNQKLKFKNKITKIGAGVVVGGLVYLMIAK